MGQMGGGPLCEQPLRVYLPRPFSPVGRRGVSQGRGPRWESHNSRSALLEELALGREMILELGGQALQMLLVEAAQGRKR